MWFASLSGLAPPVILPEIYAGSPVGLVSPPSDEKGILWWPTGFAHDTANFTVQWTDGTIDHDFAVSVALAAEEAWTYFIDTEGWPLPPTSDAYRVTIILDRGIDYPGLAVMYEDDWLSISAPVIYMNPDYADIDPDYTASLTHHEFAHAIQYAMRDNSDVEDAVWHTEAWYWESSASWMSERVRPASADVAYLSAHYAEDTTSAFDTLDWGHEYGMYLLNAYLDEHVIGWEGIQDIWAEHDGDDWLTVIERHTDEPAEMTWAAFTGTYWMRILEHAEYMYYPDLEDSPRVIEGHLGAQYLEVTEMAPHFEGGTIHLDGGVAVLLRDGWLAEIFTDHAEIPSGVRDPILIVTNPSEAPLTFSYWLEEPVADTAGDPDTGDTGLDNDTGLVNDTGLDNDTGSEAGPPIASDDPPSEAAAPEKAGGCSVSRGPALLWWSALLLVLGRRRPQYFTLQP